MIITIGQLFRLKYKQSNQFLLRCEICSIFQNNWIVHSINTDKNIVICTCPQCQFGLVDITFHNFYLYARPIKKIVKV